MAVLAVVVRHGPDVPQDDRYVRDNRQDEGKVLLVFDFLRKK